MYNFKQWLENKKEKEIPTMRINRNGETEYRLKNGDLHNDDGPAHIDLRGNQRYFQNNQLHRDNGPASISPDGHQTYYQYGVPHRTNGPASISPDGHQTYYQYGVLHRTNGPAIITSNGHQAYYVAGLRFNINNYRTYVRDYLTGKGNEKLKNWLKIKGYKSFKPQDLEILADALEEHGNNQPLVDEIRNFLKWEGSLE